MGLIRDQVTIVITAHNAQRYITRCIESVINQTYEDYQIIAVDDNSSDETSKVLRSFGVKVKLIQFNENHGPAVGRTTGLMMAKTEYIAFLDSDDYWEPSFLEKTIAFLREHHSCIAVSTGYKKIDWSKGILTGPSLDQDDKEFYVDGGSIHKNFYSFWAKYKCILTGTVMMRTFEAQQTGGQKPELRLTQDLEFWGYLATFGEWGFIPEPLFITNELSLTPKERINKFKKRFSFFSKIDLSNWASRILPKLNDPISINGFKEILCHIYTTIAFANAFSGHYERAYQLVTERPDMIENQGWGMVLSFGSKFNKVFWPLFCILLKAREYIKASLFGFFIKPKNAK